ncbi:MAG: hydrogenase maturation nickel metallochaperone HypA [Candidatus Omnitrophica bacterium]|nr:hydrogenase maturation nickel metallochaperone HypA [Candidatus Omnitrophota bacterium]
MHEYHLAESVLKSIQEKTKDMSGIKSITLIRLKIGDLKMVSKETFSETFKQVAKGTICENSKLDIEEVMGDALVVKDIEGEFLDK